MISMLKITAPRVSKFLLGVLPIFIGYALLGLICFGDVSERFSNLTETLRTLFSVVNGDIIYDTFRAIDFAGVGGQIYIYVYILIFTYGKSPLTFPSNCSTVIAYLSIPSIDDSGVNDDYCYC